jgi:hypothetical protein
MIRLVHMNSCLAAKIRFMLFKGPGSFKKIFKIGGNVDELKAYRMIQLTHPLFFHFTLPLMSLKRQVRAVHGAVSWRGKNLVEQYKEVDSSK